MPSVPLVTQQAMLKYSFVGMHGEALVVSTCTTIDRMEPRFIAPNRGDFFNQKAAAVNGQTMYIL